MTEDNLTPRRIEDYTGERYINPLTAAEIAKFNTEERCEYEQSSNAYRDIKNGMDSAKREGIKEGIKQGIEQGIKQGIEQGFREKGIAVAHKLKEMGMPLDDIISATGLSKDDVIKA